MYGETDWRAREWFVVRKAHIQRTEDEVLTPYLKMGVEARKQVLGAEGLDHKPRPRADHPLAMHAQNNWFHHLVVGRSASVRAASRLAYQGK